MRRIIVICLIINILIFSAISYTLFFNTSKTETLYLNDLTDLKVDEALKQLVDYNVEIIEVESEIEVNTVLYTVPEKDRLIYKGQTIQIYISTGEIIENYKDLTNQYYSDNIDYLEDLTDKYNINIVIEQSKNQGYADGLIISQSNFGEIIDNESLTIVVNIDDSTVIIPSFVNKNYQSAQQFFSDKDIKVIYIFSKSAYTKDMIYSQSIKENSLVLVNDNPIYFYVSTGIGD